MKQRRETYKHAKRVMTDVTRPRTRKKIPRTVWIIFVCSVLCVSIVVFMRSSYVQIASVKVDGVDADRTSDIVHSASSTLSGSYAGIIPYTNIFFFPRNKIENNLLSEMLHIKSVDVVSDGMTNILLSVEMRKAICVWCEEDMSCRYVDTEGISFASAPHFSGNLFFVFVNDGEVPHDRYVMSSLAWERVNMMRNGVGTMIEEIFSNTGRPIRMKISSGDTRELVVLDGDGTVWSIFYNDSESGKKLLSDIQTSLAYIFNEQIKHPEHKKLEYVDFRFGNKVAYKYQE